MTDFFNDQQNPFASMMNLMNAEDSETADEQPMNSMNQMMNPMLWMQQAFLMNMQVMQFLWTMPMQMMTGMMEWMSQNAGAQAPEAAPEKAAAPGGFKLGTMNIPPELLKMLMQMDMTPENLAKLQKVLDVVFAAMPESEDE